MKRGMNICWIVSIALLCGQLAMAQVDEDSQAISIAGQFYSLHKVQAGETLFSISKQYKVEVEQLRKMNRLEDDEGIAYNSILIIPMSLVQKVDTETTAKVVTKGKKGAVHEVKTGETLYSIARQYPFISTKMIKEENSLTSDTVKIGQVLKIPQSVEKKALFRRRNIDEALESKRDYVIPAGDERVDFLEVDEQGNIAEQVPEGDSTESEVTNELYDFAMLAKLQKQFEALDTMRTEVEVHRGIATWLDDTGMENQKKFYALHKELPVGTILRVQNLMNSREVYVKVIGKLPNIPENQKVVVKLSAAAAHYLNVLDDKFLVELASNTK